ncbi:hypothetical protein C8J57DRAFT_1635933 [Mycena rebaudengoi]|nr:hypothetical protein C8J57DRAFT_1635933 [Mycena rebaudengoi]
MSNTIMVLCKLAADDGSSVDINVGEGTVTCRYDHGFCKYRLEDAQLLDSGGSVRCRTQTSGSSSSSDGGFPSSSDTSISHSTTSSSTTSISSTGSISHTPTSSNTLSSGISTSSAVEGKETSLTPPIQSRSKPSSGAVAGATIAGVVCLIIALAYLQLQQRRRRINASRVPDRFIEDRADTRERIKNGGVVANPSSSPVPIEEGRSSPELGETLTNRIHREVAAQMQSLLAGARPEGVPPRYAP